MKPRIFFLLSLVVIILSANPALAQNGAAAGFEKIKSLVGEWEGEGPYGPVKVSYQIVSGGSALMETFLPANEPSMITMYHLDNGRLMMTHYCSAGNQPRMQAQPPTGEIKSINFTFIDATNLAKLPGSRMQSLTVTFVDEDHFSQVWTWRENGKDIPGTFTFTRKK